MPFSINVIEKKFAQCLNRQFRSSMRWPISPRPRSWPETVTRPVGLLEGRELRDDQPIPRPRRPVMLEGPRLHQPNIKTGGIMHPILKIPPEHRK